MQTVADDSGNYVALCAALKCPRRIGAARLSTVLSTLCPEIGHVGVEPGRPPAAVQIDQSKAERRREMLASDGEEFRGGGYGSGLDLVSTFSVYR